MQLVQRPGMSSKRKRSRSADREESLIEHGCERGVGCRVALAGLFRAQISGQIAADFEVRRFYRGMEIEHAATAL